MGIGCGQVGGSVSVHILVLIIGLLFIVISVSRAYMIMVWVLVRETIGSTVLNTSVLSGERVRHIECNIFRFFGTVRTYT